MSCPHCKADTCEKLAICHPAVQKAVSPATSTSRVLRFATSDPVKDRDKLQSQLFAAALEMSRATSFAEARGYNVDAYRRIVVQIVNEARKLGS